MVQHLSKPEEAKYVRDNQEAMENRKSSGRSRVLAPYPIVEKVLVNFEVIDEETGMSLIAEIFSRRN